MTNYHNGGAADAALLAPQSLGALMRAEWRWWLPGAVLCFFLASLVTVGWPQGLLPDLNVPYWYVGDGLSHSWLMKRLIEGWALHNDHSGYPFGSDFHDYPGADVGSLVLMKLLGLINGNFATVFNLYYLLSFSAAFASAFLVLRALRLERPYAAAAALLFTFMPFHMMRLSHLFYTWYFVAPLYFYAALRMAEGKLFEGKLRGRMRPTLLAGAGLMVLASFGVYYALFGVLVFGAVALAGLCRGEWRSVRAAAVATAFVVLGIVLNIAPNLAYQRAHGANAEVANRGIANAEVYGLKLMQLILPRGGHRSSTLNGLADMYAQNMPLVNENSTAALGLLGGAGFLAMLGVLLAATAGRRMDRRLTLLALIVTLLFLFGTIGGLGALFSMTISSSIRGWNRISVFIGFGALAGLMLLLQGWLAGRLQGRRLALGAGALCALLAGAGMWDQSGAVCTGCRAQLKQEFQQNQDFVRAIEAALPRGAAIYQLPYMPFPEVPQLHQMSVYDHMRGYLHSKELSWSYAGMKGREGDLFYRHLDSQPMAQQLATIAKLGFSGIYLNRDGYADQGAAAVAELSALTGAPPALARADGKVVFFRVPAPATPPLAVAGKSARQIIRSLYGGPNGVLNTPAALAAGIRFADPAYPVIVAAARGLSVAEGWGRWSDAVLSPTVQIDFLEPLEKRFTLALTLQPFGPNTGQPLTVRIGKQSHSVVLQPGQQTYRLPFDLGADRADRLELVPPHPVSPQSIGAGPDGRRLGIGLIQISITP
ncbi:DUF7024 domain-containing protein [Pseudoduganella aquatica]|uniref:Sugar translocase n=1 Tax=Pseudoduganella aquatica TaxID=2660641 RepID=A0A7X4HE64_9BURK|nr:sugar translocase [Pseudoduganella aquatica]MYN09588.1 sugar translocase [Pseudoduganella aquatica]